MSRVEVDGSSERIRKYVKTCENTKILQVGKMKAFWSLDMLLVSPTLPKVDHNIFEFTIKSIWLF